MGIEIKNVTLQIKNITNCITFETLQDKYEIDEWIKYAISN